VDNFVNQYPNVILFVFGVMWSVTLVMLAVISWGLKAAFSKFTTAIEQHTNAITRIDLRLAVQEAVCKLFRDECSKCDEGKGEK
jgi:hypothetical protein